MMSVAKFLSRPIYLYMHCADTYGFSVRIGSHRFQHITQFYSIEHFAAVIPRHEDQLIILNGDGGEEEAILNFSSGSEVRSPLSFHLIFPRLYENKFLRYSQERSPHLNVHVETSIKTSKQIFSVSFQELARNPLIKYSLLDAWVDYKEPRISCGKISFFSLFLLSPRYKQQY